MGATIERPRQLPDTLQEHDFYAVAKTEPQPRTGVRFLGMAYLLEGQDFHEIGVV